jgi:hypothetical protein
MINEYSSNLIPTGLNEQSDGTILDPDISGVLMKRWGGLMEDSWNPWTKKCMAQLFENERKHMALLNRKASLHESTLSTAIPDLVKYVFPLIRRVWANLISNGLFSIQPMNNPIGGIFYWEYKYGTTKGTITAGQNMIQNFDRHYSSEYVDNESIGSGTNLTGTIVWGPIKPQGMGQVGIEFVGTADSDGSQKRIYDSDGSGTLTGDTGAASTVNYTTKTYDITFSEAVSNVVANYFFSMEAEAGNVPRVNVDITLEAIKAYSRKLAMYWSSEAADDMQAVLQMAIEPELTAGVANEIALGIDRELIMSAFGSGTTNTDVFDAAVPPGRTPVDHFRGITTVLEKVSGEIATRTHRGPGNFIIIGPSVQPIFGALATHGDLVRITNDIPTPPQGQGVTGRPAFQLPQAPNGFGVYPIGFLQSKWLVIVDPHFPVGKIMVGLKGPMFTDSGVVYAPYVPLQVTSPLLDPADFTLRKGMRTRYAKKVVNPDFYGIITVSNLP